MRILLGIFLLGFILRVVFLDISPPGFNADEAALGYNAYSLLKSGKDEWGESFPLQFRSFSDYKPGLYVYLTIPFVAVLGLNEFSVRLPSILLGSISVFLIYFLSKELFKKEIVALSSALLLSISPWHIHFSRGAWETNVATFFMLLALYFFIKSQKKHSLLWISVLASIGSMYTYQGTRLVVPILWALLIIFYKKELVKRKNFVLALVTVILLIPLLVTLSGTSGLARFQGLSIFNDPGPINRINEGRGQHEDPQSLWVKLFHNKVETYTANFLGHYLDHFNPNFLFISGDNVKRNKVPDMGQMYIFEIATLFLGLYILIRKKFGNAKMVFLWLLVAPLASSLTYQTPHALRAHNMVIPLYLISGLGVGMLWERRYLVKSLVVLIIFISFIFFLDRYYLHLPKQYALEWEYGFAQIVPFLMQNKDKYQKVIFTDKYDQPYILLLFYSRYDPYFYQTQDKKQMEGRFGFSEVVSFDKFEFRPIAKEEVGKASDILFVGTGEEFDQLSIPIKTVNFPNGNTAFKIVGR